MAVLRTRGTMGNEANAQCVLLDDRQVFHNPTDGSLCQKIHEQILNWNPHVKPRWSGQTPRLHCKTLRTAWVLQMVGGRIQPRGAGLLV